MIIKLGGPSVEMPQLCACCGGVDELRLPCGVDGVGGSRIVLVPYCEHCARHVQQVPRVRWFVWLFLSVVTVGIFAASWLRRRLRATNLCTPECSRAALAVSCRIAGRVLEFDVANRRFASALIQCNRAMLIQPDADVIELAANPIASPPNREFKPVDSSALSVAAVPPPQPFRSSSPRTGVPRDPEPRARERLVSAAVAAASRVSPAATEVTDFVARSDRAPAVVGLRFVGADPVVVVGRTLPVPLTYVAQSGGNVDASTIVTSLAVGDASMAAPLPYWPSYAGASPQQRARYLDWMAGRRTDAEIDVGYAFIFFYGLERRLLVDRRDEDVVRPELGRLLTMFGQRSSSFRNYAEQLLTFSYIYKLAELSEADFDEALGNRAANNLRALEAVLGWCCLKKRPLPAQFAASVAAASHQAKRGIVVQRSAKELHDLFAVRYRERFGEGLTLEAAKRPSTIEYFPASATLGRLGSRPTAKVPDVLGNPSQFDPVVRLWNACIDDLKRLSSAKKKSDASGGLTADAWAALPAELRSQYDHPDIDRWNGLLAAGEPCGRFSITTAGNLASVAHVPEAAKLSTAQLRKIGETAAMLGVTVEPELRFLRSGREWSMPIVLWRGPATLPPRDTYLAATSILALATAVVLSDGADIQDEELRVMMRIIEDMFRLDEELRARLEGHLQWLMRQPANSAALARKLQASSKPSELATLGRLLVAVAAADGTISRGEHQALKGLYKALGLAAADLAEAIVSANARLESDDAVVVAPETKGAVGEKIPPPMGGEDPPVLDQSAIEAILADTREVTAMLSAVLDHDDEPEPPEVQPASPAPSVEADGLDAAYQQVLQELLKKPQWTAAEVRALSLKMKLMPGAIVETINTWSDATFGDYLIDDQGDWHVNADLVRRANA